MDGQHFDELTRRMTTGASRRRLLGLVTGLLGGAAITGDVAALPQRPGTCRPALVGCTHDRQCCSGTCEVGRQLPRSRRNRCACPDPLSNCHGSCVDTATDVANCGTCGTVCDNDEICVSGICEPALDCTTYDGSLAPTGGSWCMTTNEGGAALSHPCVRGQSTPCQTAADCVDEATGPGEVAVCATAYTACGGLGSCKPSYPYGPAICVVTQTIACLA